MLTKEALDSLSTDPERANWRRIAAYGLLRAFDFTGCEIEGSRRTLCYRAEVGSSSGGGHGVGRERPR